MKKFIIILVHLLILILPACAEHKQNMSENELKGMRETAAGFMKELKGILIGQIQSAGIVQAASVCSDTAQVLTNNYGIRKGVFIKRVSLRNRNKNNFPDDFEQKALNKFELMHQNKELNNETEHAEIVQEGEFKYLRYLKPILVQAECLNCHGSEDEITDEVENLITRKYPDDKATGYKIGDLRGAVSVKKILN
jgi:hypothetical protein